MCVVFFQVKEHFCPKAVVLIFFVCLFRATHPQYMEVPRLGVQSNWSCNCWPTPQPQQHSIWAVSANYTTAHSNTGFWTHRARPGTEPGSSWMLVRVVFTEPQWKLQAVVLELFILQTILHSQDLLMTLRAFLCVGYNFLYLQCWKLKL